MKQKRIWAVLILLLAVSLTACGNQDGRIKLKNAAVSDAVLYALEGNMLQYNVFCHGSAAGAIITDETGSGIDTLEKLETVLGQADAPIFGGNPEERTLGRAVTADLTTNNRGKITQIVIRTVMDRPVIGISWKSDTVGEDYRDFAEALERNGALAVYLPLIIAPEQAQQILSKLDGIFVTGGEDWNPALYGQKPQPHGSVDCNDIRDMSDLYLIRGALETDSPMLCVCRGAQGMNIALGGGLVQDVPSYLGQQAAQGLIEEARVAALPEGCDCEEQHLRVQVDGLAHGSHASHPISHIDRESKWLYDIFGRETVSLVSSAHHQAIDPERLGEGLSVAAVSADGIIEAVEYRENRFALGLQWHPERDALADAEKTDLDRNLSNLPLRALVRYAAGVPEQ